MKTIIVTRDPDILPPDVCPICHGEMFPGSKVCGDCELYLFIKKITEKVKK